MKPPVYLDDEERAKRVAYSLALEIARIVDDLELREVFLVEMWGRHRDRGPILDTLFSRYRTLGLNELALLPRDAQSKVEEFYRELEEFRLYIRFTEDMPTGLSDAYRWQLQRLNAYAEQAVGSLGGSPERPLLDIPDEVPEERSATSGPLLQLERFEKSPATEE